MSELGEVAKSEITRGYEQQENENGVLVGLLKLAALQAAAAVVAAAMTTVSGAKRENPSSVILA